MQTKSPTLSADYSNYATCFLSSCTTLSNCVLYHHQSAPKHGVITDQHLRSLVTSRRNICQFGFPCRLIGFPPRQRWGSCVTIYGAIDTYTLKLLEVVVILIGMLVFPSTVAMAIDQRCLSAKYLYFSERCHLDVMPDRAHQQLYSKYCKVL
ncbi:hypothetical protein BKA83DRAFT_1004016 [Pisolithus microcarpus]|nr:hypothetical protein BKA83DRAFT_1004016 [Pisolithus microcarpus]